MTREFKYQPEDFQELEVDVQHMNLTFDVFDDHTVADTEIKLKTKKPITKLSLNAKNLEILDVKSINNAKYEYDKEQHLLHLTFDEIPEGTEFSIFTKTICKPTSHHLEGLYFDETPKGAPPQQITQCQQWGFQRIVPCFDYMQAKCTFNTTIRGDARYTNIISNGDPDGVIDLENGRVEYKYDNTITPMATYLFFMGLGTYATFSKEFMYPNGDKFMIELLVPPDSDPEIAMQAVEVIYDSVLWVYLFTGPDKYKNWQTSQKIWDLMKQNKMEEAKELAVNLRFGYKYTGKVYREIGMQNSDFGGMENVGNTTITTNRIMPFREMSDPGFVYMMRVKAHEYYHNLNGSEVTGWSPFEIWLNEAVTVHIEREFTEYFFGKDFTRLEEVLHIVEPHGGTLYQDSTPASMPIEPDGFNDPNELITGITYVKAPEFVRMIQHLMGKEKFVEGLHLYHTRYKHSNATWMQWIESMEEVAGMSFQHMARAWLKQTGFPTIKVNRENLDDKTILHLTQTNYKEPYEFPFEWAAFDKSGNMIEEGMLHFKQEKETITIPHSSDNIGFISLSRGFSFYGKVGFEESEEELFLKVKNETDVVSKFLAYDKLMSAERLRLMLDKNASAREDLIDLVFEILNNKELMSKVGSQIISIFDSVPDEKLNYKYQELYEVREKIFKSIATKYEKELHELYQFYNSKEYHGSVNERRIASIKDRSVKNTCLGLLAKLDKPYLHEILREQFKAENASDKISALRGILNSSMQDKGQILKDYEREASKNLVSWEIFLASVARNESNDAIDIMKEVEKSEFFRIDQANDQRALFAVFAHNKRKSLCTDEGRAYLKHAILKVGRVNEYNTLRILDCLGSLDRLDSEHQRPLVKMINEILSELDEKEQPSVTNWLKRLLKGSPNALKA